MLLEKDRSERFRSKVRFAEANEATCASKTHQIVAPSDKMWVVSPVVCQVTLEVYPKKSSMQLLS